MVVFWLAPGNLWLPAGSLCSIALDCQWRALIAVRYPG